MPVNQDGEEVNQDGTPITDEQKETSDWTQVIELNQKSTVKPYDINILATNTIPTNIPYLEVFRTDELYFKDYESLFSSTSEPVTGGADGSINTGSSDETSGGDASSQTSSSNGGSSSSSSNSKHKNKGKTSSSSGKVRTNKLKSEITNLVKKYYKKSANVTTITNRYMNCRTDKVFIASVTMLHYKHLKSTQNLHSLNEAIYNAKHKYS